MRPIGLLFASGLTALLIAPAQGQPGDGAERAEAPILHEYLPGEANAKALMEFAAQAGPGRLPPGFSQEGEQLRRPKDGLAPRPRERAIKQGEPDTRRKSEAKPDRETLHDGQLHYNAVFNPSVVPFKRVTALDGVNEQFVLFNRRPALEPVGLTPFSGSPGRTLFWGSVLLDGKRNESLPLPSVAPDMEIHGYQTVPTGVEVSFLRDGADNFAVALGRAAKVRLRFLVSAPTRYFGRAVPPHLVLDDVPRSKRPQVPSEVRAVAGRMHQRLGLDPADTIANLLHRMVAHFRAFEEGPLAIQSGNTYEDLTVSQRGVCRHRSYAFVITALSLGLPARYLTNEAHAFVEVWIPRTGWIRIDLGGAASELRVSGAEDKAVHRPVEDPFPKPPSYSQNYSRLSGAVEGLTPAQRRPPHPATGHGSRRRLGDEVPVPVPGDQGPPHAADPGPATPPPLWLSVSSAVTSGLRGESLVITGKVSIRAKDAPLRRHPVELLLQAPGSNYLIVLGETSSLPDGSFSLTTTVPLAIPVGTYRVIAYSPQDRSHRAAWSD
ncbi:MAG: transglutaminase domain-containing protein [Polyangia bacterium]|jgi:hypothetical protein|nr:transglutaminase domain-containing protein [Polyangia bacterium]